MYRIPSSLILLLLLTAVIPAAVGGAEASWRLDADRFAASAHADLSCTDCHENVTTAMHPNPDNVNRTPGASFDPASCYTCHPDVETDVAKGSHAATVADTATLSNCLLCHDPHIVGAPETAPATPQPHADDQACLVCHAAPGGDTADAAAANRSLCFTCHATPGLGSATPLLALDAWKSTPHAELDCLTCHPGSDASPHTSMGRGDCLACHARHPEATAHDAHSGVSCQACHLQDVIPVKNTDTGKVEHERPARGGLESLLHDMHLESGQGCERCHTQGNAVGAVAMVLPAKGVFCMPCHAGSVTAADTVSLLTLAGLGLGLSLLFGLWISASGGLSMLGHGLGRTLAGLSTLCTPAVCRALLLDVFLQRRLWLRSRARWGIHALIFYPFVIRCLWGLTALAASHWVPEAQTTLALLDKNAPLGAFLFDLTGLMLGTGLVLAWLRGRKAEQGLLPGLPRQDRLLLGLLLGITLTGFLAEGMRMALTQAPPAGHAAFIGSLLSWVFSGAAWLDRVYGYVWYLHAILTGATVLYMPFSRLMHVIVAPVVLAVKAARASGHGHHE